IMTRPGCALAGAALLLATGGLSTPAADYFFAVDVPARLGAVDYMPNQIMRRTGGTYSVALTLASGLEIAGLARREDAAWLLSPAVPVNLDGIWYEPRDVIKYDGSYSMFLDGSARGIPAGVRIDAIDLDASGTLLLSFDVPVTLSGSTFLPGDIVQDLGSGFVVYWDSTASGVPPGANLVGFDVDTDGSLIQTWDVPVDLGGTVFLPGTLVRFIGGTFSTYAVDPAWPRSVQARGIALTPGAGAIPGGQGLPGPPLRVEKTRTGDLLLRWDASCESADSDYAVYAGAMPDWTGSQPATCSTGGALQWTLTPAPGQRFYLVVPQNGVAEGSYGRDSSGTERPPSAAACEAQVLAPCVP
ncbi:MAG: hypothetical protein D6685_14310, partial [Bacteroidetes bacterium]